MESSTESNQELIEFAVSIEGRDAEEDMRAGLAPFEKGVEKDGQKVEDIGMPVRESHELFCEMLELVADNTEEGQVPKYYWAECARYHFQNYFILF